MQSTTTFSTVENMWNYGVFPIGYTSELSIEVLNKTDGDILSGYDDQGSLLRVQHSMRQLLLTTIRTYQS